MQHLSSTGGCRTLPAQGKISLLELQTRKMERVCLISMCLCCVLRRMELQMPPCCGPFPYCVKNDMQLPTHKGSMDGKDLMGTPTLDGVMWHRQMRFLQRGLRWCWLRCPDLQSFWFLLCSAWMAETSFTICFATSQPGNCSSERGRVKKKYVTRSVCSTLQLHPLPREELWSLPASRCSRSVT